MARLTIASNTVVQRAPSNKLGAPYKPTSGGRASAIVPPLGWARLEDEDNVGLSLLVKLGEGVADLTTGVPRWDLVPLPGRTSATRYRDRPPLRFALQLFFDNLREGLSVEADIAALIGMLGRGTRGDDGEPPHLIVDTAGVCPYDAQTYPDVRWVIAEDPQWGDALWNDAGHRVRQLVTITLMQFVSDQIVSEQSLAFRRAHHRGNLAVKKTYRVHQGDTLVSIARRELGSVDRWIELAKLNPGQPRDPRRGLKAGTVIRLR